MEAMNRRTFLTAMGACLVARPAVAEGEDKLKTNVTEMVDGAASAIEHVGLLQATRFTAPETWVRPESGLYVFVFDTKGVLHLHPQQNVIGAQIRGSLDAEGTPFIERILAALSEGDGQVWTEFLWRDQTAGRMRKKRVYSRRTGELIVNCGYYLDAT
jgi:signal transduction histidine kinase